MYNIIRRKYPINTSEKSHGIKRVVLLCDFFSSLGGTEAYNFTLALQLRKRGIEVRIYVGERPRLTHWVESAQKESMHFDFPSETHNDLESNLIEIGYMNSIVDEINDWKPDVIHVHPFKKMAIQWLKHPRHNPDIPLVATEWTIPNEKSRHWFDPEMHEYIDNVAVYVATCSALTEGIQAVHKYKGPIAQIPHLVHTPVQAIKTDSNKHQSIAFVGRFSQEKGVQYLLQSWADVIKAYPQASLTLYGHGQDMSQLRTMATTLGIGSSVMFAGTFKPFTGIDDIASKHQIFVQPSVFESIPTSLIELMLRGKTVIATDVGGVNELVDESTGMLIDPEDPKSISGAILKLLDDPELVVLLGSNARRATAENYNLEQNMDKIISVYQSLSSTSI